MVLQSRTSVLRSGFGVEEKDGIISRGEGWISTPMTSPALPGTQNGVLSITGILLLRSSDEVGLRRRFVHNLLCILFQIRKHDANPANRTNSTMKGRA